MEYSLRGPALIPIESLISNKLQGKFAMCQGIVGAVPMRWLDVSLVRVGLPAFAASLMQIVNHTTPKYQSKPYSPWLSPHSSQCRLNESHEFSDSYEPWDS